MPSDSENFGSSLVSGISLTSSFDARLKTLVIQSECLKGNPWNDPNERRHYVYTPLTVKNDNAPVVLYLPGFLSAAPKSFAFKGHEQNFFETLLGLENAGTLPPAHFVSVDAWTTWGGSQYLNSVGMGLYEDHLLTELLPAVSRAIPCNGNFAVIGGSSGGYGALSLLRSGKFKAVAAVAPDSFFEASLLPDVYKAIPTLKRYDGVSGVLKKLKSGELLKSRSYFSVVNAIAMGLCYAPSESGGGTLMADVDWPVDFKSGALKADVWSRWLKNDPIHFLADLKPSDTHVNLSAGVYDEFNLQFGAEQLRSRLSDKCRLTYSSFEGSHRDISGEWPAVMSWLSNVL